ncbi:sulfurase [bacterium]|nr:sulfurase [bacterium]
MPMVERSEPVMAQEGRGLALDRYAYGQGSYNKDEVGRRQVTLINARFIKDSGFTPIETRRNLVVSDIELMWLIGREFSVGRAIFKGVKYCDPCRVPRSAADPSLDFSKVFEDRGGLIAQIVVSGWIAVGDDVVPPT